MDFFHSPPHPTLTEEDRLDWLRLLRSRRVGPITFWRLLEAYGSAEAALAALPDLARTAGVEDFTPCPPAVAQAEIQAGRRAGARLVARGEAGYPPDLAALGDAPPLLWIKGNIDVTTRPLIAMVGARSASSLGLRMARALAEDLAHQGFTLVSGLARGIDTAVHQASLAQATIAVLPGGIDVMTPAENAPLAEAIAEEGLLVSEHPPGLQPMARHFAGRNRLISGMSRAVIVVEAAVKSGSLITARNALDQGRDVMAVPGHPFDSRAAGCNLLLREGAALVRNARDVIEALGDATPQSAPRFVESAQPACLADSALPQPMARPPLPHGYLPANIRSNAQGTDQAKAPRQPDDSRKSGPLAQITRLPGLILSRLGAAPLHEDALIAATGSSAKLLAPALTELELDGQIARSHDGMITRCS